MWMGTLSTTPAACSQTLTIDQMCARAETYSEDRMTSHPDGVQRAFSGQDSIKTLEKHKLTERCKGMPGQKKHLLSLTQVGKKFVENLFQSRAEEILEKLPKNQDAEDDPPDIKYARRIKEAESTRRENKKRKLIAPSTASMPDATPSTPASPAAKKIHHFFRPVVATVTPPRSNNQRYKVEEVAKEHC
jgi:hypothetical protein